MRGPRERDDPHSEFHRPARRSLERPSRDRRADRPGSRPGAGACRTDRDGRIGGLIRLSGTGSTVLSKADYAIEVRLAGGRAFRSVPFIEGRRDGIHFHEKFE
jgi:hypothetical protein